VDEETGNRPRAAALRGNRLGEVGPGLAPRNGASAWIVNGGVCGDGITIYVFRSYYV
jgi:hypothetical protein